MPIRRADFKRIRDRVDRIGNVWTATLGFTLMLFFLGVGSAAALTLFGLRGGQNDLETWVEPVLFSVSIASVLFAVICWFWHRDTKRRLKDDVKLICDDMDQIESDYEYVIESS